MITFTVPGLPIGKGRAASTPTPWPTEERP
jgi:hypothetical protein